MLSLYVRSVRALWTSVCLCPSGADTSFARGDRKACTVLVVSTCVEHDGTSYAALKRLEVEF